MVVTLAAAVFLVLVAGAALYFLRGLVGVIVATLLFCVAARSLGIAPGAAILGLVGGLVMVWVVVFVVNEIQGGGLR
jgi:hypothetical protein